MANWVAKTHFLLTDDVMVEAGEHAAVRLPPHWLTLVVALGAWSAGLTVGEDTPARVGFGHDANDIAALAEVDDVFALALAPWGQGYPDRAPQGATDFTTAVRPQADAFTQIRAVPAPDAGPLVAAATERAAELRLPPSARVLVADTVDASTWLAPLTVLGSLVIVVNADAGDVGRIAATERVDVVAPPLTS